MQRPSQTFQTQQSNSYPNSFRSHFNSNINGNTTIQTNESPSLIDEFKLQYNINRLPLIANNDNLSNVQSYLNRLKNYGEIENFLNINRSYESFSSYLANFDKFKRHLESKIFTKVATIPNDEISKTILNNVLKLVYDDLINTLMPSMYARIEKNDNKYREFLKIFNNYLNSIGIYTYNNIREKSKICEEHYNYFEINTIPTSNVTLDGIISKVERLPYCIKYYNEDDCTDFTFKEGKLTIYSKNY